MDMDDGWIILPGALKHTPKQPQVFRYPPTTVCTLYNSGECLGSRQKLHKLPHDALSPTIFNKIH